jgi:hypothetical protein
MTSHRAEWTKAVLRVGDGRGYVITAGHCLPQLPPCHGASYTEERTYKLLGRIGEEPAVCAEIVFVDPIADLAVLGEPDGQELYQEWEAFNALVGASTPLPIGGVELTREPITLPSSGEVIPGPPEGKERGCMLSITGEWFACEVRALSRTLVIENAAQRIAAGMSGSPIVTEAGIAVGIVCLNAPGPNPHLAKALPAWLVEELT